MEAKRKASQEKMEAIVEHYAGAPHVNALQG
jgi:hypothetical protein